MTPPHKRADSKFSEQALLIAIVCLAAVFVAMFAVSSGMLPGP